MLSSAFIWVFYFFIIKSGITSAKESLEGILLYSGFFFPIVFLIVVIIPSIYIRIILRNEERKLEKGFLYYILSWVLFWGLINATVPIATWVQNEMFFGGQGEEHKQILLLKAETSLEEKLNQKFELVEADYNNSGSFSKVSYYLNFQEESCDKDCPIKQVYLSHEDQGWRMKIINGEIWYLEE